MRMPSAFRNVASFATTSRRDKAGPVADYLLPIADKEPLTWIVTSQQTAFAANSIRLASRLQPGDRLLLYATRGCFRNPTRDRGRVIGVASVRGPVERLKRSIRFGEREYGWGVKLQIHALVPRRQGVELAPLVSQLKTFPDPRSWSARMRRALVPLDPADAETLISDVGDIAAPYPEALDTYRS